jgi:hypothetical protein
MDDDEATTTQPQSMLARNAPGQRSNKSATNDPQVEYVDINDIRSTAQLLATGEKYDQNKIDLKDFKRWTGFGGSYIAKLIQILTDLTVEGTEEGDAFHIRML